MPLPYHHQVSLCYDIALDLPYLHVNEIIYSRNNALRQQSESHQLWDVKAIRNAPSHDTPHTVPNGLNWKRTGWSSFG